jgi:DNA processing protein
MTAHACWTLDASDPAYPACLLASPDPPRRLYGIGDPAELRPGLAVIGSRKATPYGRACARRFASWAAGEGVCVVSGAAYGCDLEAHAAAIEAEGSSVAVLGCGPDVDYPEAASGVLQSLRETGAVIAEVPFGHEPRPWAFPRRNRIIAALSVAVLVVEAALPSGTFSTADHALEAGRDVLSVPGSVFSAGSAGTNRLIRQGATPITEVEDLRDALDAAGLLLATQREASGGMREPSDPVERALLADPMSPDALALALGLDVAEVLRRVALLEAAGRVARYPDGRYGAG